VQALLRELGPDKPHAITLVFMGMGEPLHNLENLHRAIRVLNHPRGLNISTRRITVSTSGLVPGIEKLAKLSPRPWLAVSLNASTDEGRSRVMPVNRVWNMTRLREALAAWPLEPREKLTIEYVLMSGVNDTLEDAERLAAWMGELKLSHNLNLIRMNEHEGTGFQEPLEDRVTAFVWHLKDLGCFVTVRKSRGRDVQGACGQLAKRD
jgi:23S rRNA (adenine2503-C2)-methyltransferase